MSTKRHASASKYKNLVIIGEKVLIRTLKNEEKTSAGLYLPPTVLEKEEIASGYIIKIGPGFAIPIFKDEDNYDYLDETQFIPLQVRPGDLALFLRKEAYEIQYKKENLYIVHQNAILMVERDEGLFDF